MDRIILRKSFKYFFLIIFIFGIFSGAQTRAESSWATKKVCVVTLGSIFGVVGLGSAIGKFTQPLRADAEYTAYPHYTQYRVKDVQVGARDHEIEEAFKAQNIPLPKTRIKIKFRPQIHEDVKTEVISEYTARAQFAIAQNIKKNPKKAYFDEGTFRDIPFFSQLPDERLNSKSLWKTLAHPEGVELSPKEIEKRIQKIFPNGLPEKYAKLTAEQRERLYFDGASTLLFWLGVTDKIKTEDEVLSKKALQLLKDRNLLNLPPESHWNIPEIRKIVYTDRELEVFKNVAIFHTQNPRREIELIFGAAHQFETYNGKYFDIEVVD
ncbi:MAG: hypothetical protein J0L93_01715 [Deltaproteobacteria bacterium]|nr:hypothetical protein [Deltaproteobacteria bacterium]